ncbi:nicotinamidase [Edwardsiella hoshinae]|uniref:Nicotinamidase n=1 Tax=Edwardsiella hoshinae TaxID=93378 RepID=A0A376DG69_9GAMM|nr:bifunctional nicotinamidase/pyrazinamidase [Edwardsiella hoshinae]AOV97186.1 nicotinamidase [Edwardsiella hoshinae]QPR26970.1 bifunctional nicotinamidase/pyrazinamidase [Edwardsiella hoshinae]STC88897.1 nicotinamidase/pyrazinamidase [Edwardsiella hoshinae]
MSAALLLIDLQNDFCPQGALAVPRGDEVIPVALQAVEMARRDGIPVIATQDWHPADHGSFATQSGGQVGAQGELNGLPQVWWPDHCVQNTIGAAFHPALRDTAFDFVVHKGSEAAVDSYSAFFDNGQRAATALHAWLQQHGITHLWLLGLATDYCVKFSVLDALRLGYRVTVIQDGCRGVDLTEGDSDRALTEMQAAGATLTTLDAIPSLA